MSKPQIVLVPGAWNSPEGFGAMTKNLESHGYNVHTRQMPSVGNDNPPRDLIDDVQALRSLIKEAIGNGNDVIVAPHSWGGIVAGSATTGLDKESWEAQGGKGGVVKLAYMASFLLPEGVSMMNACGDRLPAFIKIEGPHAIVDDSTALFNDLSSEQKQYWTSKLQSQAFASLQAKASGAAWRDVPTSYLMCEEDRAIPPSAQEYMVVSAKEARAVVDLERIKAGHFPFLTQPEAVANFIRKVAGEAV